LELHPEKTRLVDFRAPAEFWRKWLSRRSWKSHVAWERFLQLVDRYPLPAPRIVHRYT
jgi:hypothetical protein